MKCVFFWFSEKCITVKRNPKETGQSLSGCVLAVVPCGKRGEIIGRTWDGFMTSGNPDRWPDVHPINQIVYDTPAAFEIPPPRLERMLPYNARAD